METRGRKRDQGSGGADGRRRKHPRSDPEAARAPQLPPSNSTTTRNKTSTRTANTPVNTPRASRRASASPPSATSGADSAAAHAVSARRARAPAASPSTRNLTPNKRHPSHRAGHSQSQASASAASPPVVGGRPKGAKSKETEGGPSAADPEAMDRRHRGRNRDEDDDDDESESLSRQLAAATRGGMTSSALQGLLRKLGAGLDDLVPNASMAHSRLKHILQGLRAEGEEGRQIEALTNLCELLSIATEESLATFSVDSFVPALVGLLNAEHNPDLMLLAARALTHLADVLPPSCAAIVHYQAVPCFCARLLTIEYIDLAEQSLQALEKLSHEHPGACLRAGGLAAVLSYLDFFATGVQRVALATAANMCRQLPADAEEMVVDCVPILTNLLTYQDTKLVEQACVCLSRISESFASSPARITMLCSHGLMEQVARLVAEEGVGPVTGATWAGLVGLLATCAAGSADVSRSLLRLRVTLTMRNVLVGSGLLSPAPASPASPLLSSSHNLLPILNLLHHLLPPVPEKEAASKAAGEAGTSTVRASTRRSSSRGREEQGADDMKVESPPGREPGWWVVEEPTLLVAYGEDVLALLLQVYAVSTSGAVRHKCLSTIHRFLHYSPPAQLEALLGNMAISSFLAGLISGKDSTAALMGVTLAELLMTKLPAVFARFFLKEGVVHAMDQLAATPPPAEGWSSLSAQSTPTPSPTAASTPAGRRSHAQRSQRGQGGDVTPQGTPNQGAPPSSPHTPRPSSVRAEAVTRAQSFKRAFGSELEQHGGVTEGLAKLQSLAGALAEHKAQPARQKESLRALLAALADADGVSTFEFVGSGAAAALVRWLTAEPEGGKEEEPHAATVTRLATLWDALQETGASGALVRKLQEAVSAMESVPVQLSQGSRGGGASLSSQLAVLTQPFKLRLCRDSHDRSLRDYSSNVVLIEPLATLSAVEDFLWPRVRRPTTTTTTTPKANSNPYTAGRRSSKDKSSSGRGKSPAKDAQESPSPMTRSKAATTNSTEKKSAAENKTAAGSSGKGKAKLEAEGSAPRASRQAARSSREASGPLKTRKASRTDRDATSPRGARSLPSELELPPSHPMEECEEDDTDDDEHDFALEGMEGLDDDEEMEEEEEEEEEDGASGNSESVQEVLLGDGGDTPTGVAGKTGSTPAPPRFADPPQASSSQSGGGGGIAAAMAAAAAENLKCASSSNRGGKQSSAAAAAAAAASATPRLQFSLHDRALPAGMSIFQAIQLTSSPDMGEEEQEHDGGEHEPEGGRRMWEQVHPVFYNRYNAESSTPGKPKAALEATSHVTSQEDLLKQMDAAKEARALPSWAAPVASLVHAAAPLPLPVGDNLQDTLVLLRVMEEMNRVGPRLKAVTQPGEGIDTTPRVAVAREEFVNSKLSSKLSRQLLDVLTLCGGEMPLWCRQLTLACPFLFPFDVRRQYFFCTAFGLSRALQRLQSQQGTSEPRDRETRELRLGRLQRQKVRVSRNRILDSAAKVMELYCSHKAVLEVEYFGEVGTGLGPTLEFYTLVSLELQKEPLGLWRHLADPTQSNTDLVNAPHGLFPAPLPPSDTSEATMRRIERFRLLGRVMAKALQDGRLLDMNISAPLYKMFLGRTLGLYDIRALDPTLGSTLEELEAICRKKVTVQGKAASLADLKFRGCSIEDMSLDFTLPGHPTYKLSDKGAEQSVMLSNLEEYVAAVVDATVGSGIQRQVDAIKAGFQQVLSLGALRLFNEMELEALLCGCGEKWEIESLKENIKFDHGYTASSLPLQHMLQIMCELGPDDQRAFLRFVTGSPRLPPGGLSALSPKLTIVRKHPSAPQGSSSPAMSSSPVQSDALLAGTVAADNDLPSVMTCANYLKLPPYSCKAVMKERVLYAIHEGSASFDLS
mmetsp:Transcript_34349/g.65613  ORF Transcript_34349/g.65613 Transcript_34349/m.65613 type:complete len:1886 (+) Transcript_34349:253-5910(+)